LGFNTMGNPPHFLVLNTVPLESVAAHPPFVKRENSPMHGAAQGTRLLLTYPPRYL